MLLTLVRHGESTANVAATWQGQGDSPLSPTGRGQVERLGIRLSGRSFDRILSSDLSRASDTAGALGRPVSLDQRWREIHVGTWEGLTRQETVERYPEQVDAMSRGATDVKIGGGESWEDVRSRAELAVSELVSSVDANAHVLVVSHGGTISVLIASLLRLGTGSGSARPARGLGRITNTGCTTLRLSPGRAELVSFNDTAHLEGNNGFLRERLLGGVGAIGLVARGDDNAPWPERLLRLDNDGTAESAFEIVRKASGTLFGTVLEPQAIADLVTARLAAPHSVAVPAPGSVTHVTLASEQIVIADFASETRATQTER